LSGLFVWTGFDYLGEPTPYPWPARSSYFGIVDLAGFPKDIYYMYQSEWTTKPVLHIFPHWNWRSGQLVDIWAYYNNADEVELFLDGKSLGVRKKMGDDLHVMWRVPFQPGTLKIISRKHARQNDKVSQGKTVLVKQISTAGRPARIVLVADRKILKADGRDLCFVTAKVLDKDGNLVPNADNFIRYTIKGEGSIVGTDNGYQADTTALKAHQRRCWNGMALIIIRSTEKKGNITLSAMADGLERAFLTLKTSD
jgi:beta-galactosidase